MKLCTDSRVEKSEHLQLMKVSCRIEANSETFFSDFCHCFGEIGTLNTAHDIEVKDNVKPVVIPVRKVSHTLKPKLKKNSNKWLI